MKDGDGSKVTRFTSVYGWMYCCPAFIWILLLWWFTFKWKATVWLYSACLLDMLGQCQWKVDAKYMSPCWWSILIVTYAALLITQSLISLFSPWSWCFLGIHFSPENETCWGTLWIPWNHIICCCEDQALVVLLRCSEARLGDDDITMTFHSALTLWNMIMPCLLSFVKIHCNEEYKSVFENH